MKVLLSAGHGGTDPGASAVDGQTEHALAAELGNLVAKTLIAEGHTVSVQTEEYHANVFRVTDRQGSDVAVSLHFNAYNGGARGTEVLWGSYNKVGSRILDQIGRVLEIPNRGMKQRNNLFILNSANFDCLVETCFIDNASDYAQYQKNKAKVGQAIAYGILGKSIPLPRQSTDGFYTVRGRTHFKTSKGTDAKGYVCIGTDHYYFDEKGQMCTGVFEVDGRLHRFGTDGKALQGFWSSKGKTYYFDRGGKGAKGYVCIGTDHYYFNEKGEMCTGAFEIDGRLYNFDKDGKAKYGWEQFNGNLYFFDINGRSARGLVYVGDDQYYFDPKTSVMQTGTHKVELTFGSDGKRILK